MCQKIVPYHASLAKRLPLYSKNKGDTENKDRVPGVNYDQPVGHCTDSGPLSSGQSSLVQCRRRWGAAWAGPWAPAHLHGVLPWQAWAAGDIVSCLIDLDEGTLSFSL